MSKKSVHLTERIFSLVQENPGLSSTQIAKQLSVGRTTAFLHLRKLLSLNKIRVEGKTSSVRYFPHEFVYVGSNIRDGIEWTPNRVQILKAEVICRIESEYDEVVSQDELEEVFDQYCMYIAPDDTFLVGFDGFVGWCTDSRHNFSDRIVEKAKEYLEICGSIEYRRKRNGMLDASESARANLRELVEIGFDHFFFLEASVLENGFGRSRTALELYHGKLGNQSFLEQVTDRYADTIRQYVKNTGVDCLAFAPPTHSRKIQFRDVLEKSLNLKLRKIKAEKIPPFGRILQPQKDIHDRKHRVHNASMSLSVEIPPDIAAYKHILILDDSFTTGATPNAIARKIRDGGYSGKISIITICGSFSYDLAITEHEI